MQNLTSYSCSATPVSYNSECLSRVVCKIWRQTTDDGTTLPLFLHLMDHTFRSGPGSYLRSCSILIDLPRLLRGWTNIKWKHCIFMYTVVPVIRVQTPMAAAILSKTHGHHNPWMLHGCPHLRRFYVILGHFLQFENYFQFSNSTSGLVPCVRNETDVCPVTTD